LPAAVLVVTLVEGSHPSGRVKIDANGALPSGQSFADVKVSPFSNPFGVTVSDFTSTQGAPAARPTLG